MGRVKFCDDCIYFARGEAFLADGKCSYLNASASRSCNNFIAKPIYEYSLVEAYVDFAEKGFDCEELTALRYFRDCYMETTEENSKLVREYYKITPAIVNKINASPEQKAYYRYIGKIVSKCVKLINAEEYERVVSEYKIMVLKLKKEFNL